MATGKRHNGATRIAAIAMAPLGLYLGGPVAAVALVLGGLMNIMVGPDLDMPTKTTVEAYLLNFTGKTPVSTVLVRTFGWLYFWYWMPYAQVIPHRHPASHWPILGTFLRLIYMIPVFALLWAISPAALMLIFTPSWAMWFVIGLITTDTLHFLYDTKAARPILRGRRKSKSSSPRRQRQPAPRQPTYGSTGHSGRSGHVRNTSSVFDDGRFTG